jgi:type II secretory pathway pseudopilin PulG
MKRRQRQYGATYLLMLFAVAALGLGLAAFGSLWATQAQRERESELLFIGGEFARAISRYRAADPAGLGEGPRDLRDLLLDPRQPFVLRHLRRLYRDPMTGETDWIVERQGEYIVGVRSRSSRPALRSSGLPAWVSVGGSAGETRYSDWLFRGEQVAVGAPR